MHASATGGPYSFRKSGGVAIAATACILAIPVMGVVALAGGVANHQSDRVVLGAVLVVVGGLFAGLFLATQLRAGTLIEIALRVAVGITGHVSVPLSEIVEVGMVYTIPAGWLSYIWRDDGTAVRLPLMKLKAFLPDRRPILRIGMRSLPLRRALRASESSPRSRP